VRVNGLPLSIVFWEEPHEVVIYAVRPDAKDPDYWLLRVR
jgi:hypothetical protein